jgi:hypothetical protein
VGALAEQAGGFEHPQVIAALDQLTAICNDEPLPHGSLLPFNPK